ncbi:C-type lectin domain family 10 member A [Nibea albiflora]|uniref:C-type lectin domain family 10 member A n=1 Tax=Nibea albiflora TaxID=240163 RepID=A0ACB7FJJ1_NIBAL|nr:C-type lectin domain family 10 member A [Nibea albiflora]
MEMADYVNKRPRCGQKRGGEKHQTVHSSNESTPMRCNATHFSDQNKLKEVQDCEPRRNDHNRLQEKFNALTKDINECENRNTILNNRIKKVQEEMDRLKGLTRCPCSQWCLPDWRLINSRCYFISSESKTWSESRKYCQTKGADLVVINSEEEQKALYRLDGDVHLLFWIGLSNVAGTFKWVDGSVLTKKFWQTGQPDHGGVNNREDCVEMYHFNPELANWNDAPCERKRCWLCEGSMFTITP